MHQNQTSPSTSPQKAGRAIARPAAPRRRAALALRLARAVVVLIPHVSIIISGVMVVLLIVDHANASMGFMDQEGTKALIFALSLASIITAMLAITYQRRAGDRDE